MSNPILWFAIFVCIVLLLGQAGMVYVRTYFVQLWIVVAMLFWIAQLFAARNVGRHSPARTAFMMLSICAFFTLGPLGLLGAAQLLDNQPAFGSKDVVLQSFLLWLASIAFALPHFSRKNNSVANIGSWLCMLTGLGLGVYHFIQHQQSSIS